MEMTEYLKCVGSLKKLFFKVYKVFLLIIYVLQ